MDIVIFGITGDLARKKLLPALGELIENNELPTGSRLIGFARSKYDDPLITESITGDYSKREDLDRLADVLRKDVPALFYFAVPQAVYRPLLQSIHDSRLKGKIMLEKPFGLNLDSAKELRTFIEERFDSDDIFLVDHYAGKVELQLENLSKIDRVGIKKIEIKLLEDNTLEKRGGFYDKLGALFDVGQNHILFTTETILAYIAGEKNRASILEKLIYKRDHSILGQYDGYLDVEGVAPDSKTETFFKIEAEYINTSGNIEVVMIGAKAMATYESSITIFRENGSKEKINFVSGTEAYKNIFRYALANKRENFPTYDEVIFNWKFIEQAKNNERLVIYKNPSLPEDVIFGIK